MALTTAPELVFPNFEILFIVETEACGVGIGAIILQLEYLIAYFSKKLSLHRQQESTHAKELWALTEAIHKWRHYLLGSEFVIKMDHSSLKNLLSQVIQSSEQQYFLTQLLGFSFTIVYKRGKENTVTDALSRLPEFNDEGLTEFSTLVSSP